MGDKWIEIEELLKAAVVNDSVGDLALAVEKVTAILRRLDERYGGCDQKAEWKLYSQHAEFVTYSCTAHLSLMAVPQTDYINSLDIDADRDCCYRE